MERRRIYIGTFPDGSQILVNRWIDEDGNETSVDAATRPNVGWSWGPPITLTREH